MLHGRRVVVALATLGAALVVSSVRSEAHKPITSPYTYNEDVHPILRERCGRCHVSGGAAPMSLMTHQDTVPWSESIRIELMAGHMPPWGVDTSAEKFRHPQSLTARELNVILTWASGGTPIGSSEKTPATVQLDRSWRLGTPDEVRPLPEFAMTAEKQEDTVDFTIATNWTEPRWLRAVDLQPGNPAIVRDARIVVNPTSPANRSNGAPSERVLAVWVPGDDIGALENGTAFLLPAGAELAIRMHYKKTWEYERVAMTDRSSVGLYFSSPPATEVRALTLSPPVTLAQGPALSFEQTIDEDLRAIAVYPDPALADVTTKVEAVRPDGSHEQLIVMRAQKGWARRYWFSRPVTLSRGTKISVHASVDTKAQPAATTPAPALLDPSILRLTLNVVPAR